MGTAYANIRGSDNAVQIQLLSWVLAKPAVWWRRERESEDLISASLLARIDFNRKVLELFRLGMSNWQLDWYQRWGRELRRLWTTKEAPETKTPPSVEHEVDSLTYWQWIVARNERSSLSGNIDVDILSRPVDKDSNYTELCRVLCLLVVPPTKPL